MPCCKIKGTLHCVCVCGGGMCYDESMYKEGGVLSCRSPPYPKPYYFHFLLLLQVESVPCCHQLPTAGTAGGIYFSVQTLSGECKSHKGRLQVELSPAWLSYFWNHLNWLSNPRPYQFSNPPSFPTPLPQTWATEDWVINNMIMSRQPRELVNNCHR